MAECFVHHAESSHLREAIEEEGKESRAEVMAICGWGCRPYITAQQGKQFLLIRSRCL